MSLKFLYFDLGIVLVDFSIERMLRQMAEVSGIPPERVKAIVFGGGLHHEYELGHVSTRDYYERFCRESGAKPPLNDLLRAAGKIFTLNVPMIAVAAQLQQAGWPLGILSNTCPCHWEYCFKEYRMLSECFQTYALSNEIGAVKPEAAIFQAAAKLAGYAPEELFFVDDIAGHVSGAKAAGIDAVQYTSVSTFVADLRRRGLKFNY